MSLFEEREPRTLVSNFGRVLKWETIRGHDNILSRGQRAQGQSDTAVSVTKPGSGSDRVVCENTQA